MTDCLFCRIVSGELPATVVQKNDRFVAFRDLHPQAPTHILVVPREHVRSLNEAKEPEMLGGLLSFARDIALAEGIGTQGYRVVLNTNGNGGQTVFHIHAHVLGGRAMKWPPGNCAGSLPFLSLHPLNFGPKRVKAGILSDLRKHRHYEKPSERKKRKQADARRKGRTGRFWA